jgi:hypothetical protein
VWLFRYQRLLTHAKTHNLELPAALIMKAARAAFDSSRRRPPNTKQAAWSLYALLLRLQPTAAPFVS